MRCHPLALVPAFLAVAISCPGGSVRGTITSTDTDAGSVRFVEESGAIHEALQVGPGDATIGYRDRLVEGELVLSGGAARLEKVRPVDGERFLAMEGVNRHLVREAASLGRGKALGRGDYLPDFALIDQRAEAVFGRDLRDRATVLTFIFTRCASAEMCPMTSTRLAGLAKEVEARGIPAPRYVVVSFDPEHDTPGVLNQYARAYGMDSDDFHFLTGSKEAIEALVRMFGITVFAEDGTLNHNLATILADPRGRIVLRQDGSRWSADAILAELGEGR